MVKNGTRNAKHKKRATRSKTRRATLPPYLAYVHPHIYQKRGKYGMGTYARKAIPEGTIIIKELPQNIPDSNDDDYRFKLIKHLLEGETRDDFLQMVPTELDNTMETGLDLSEKHAAFLPELTDDEMKLYYLKIRRNAFSFENHPSLLFYSTRMNHSCEPHVSYYKDTTGEKDGEKDCMTFKTKRPIRANEEIFDAYINGSMPKAERQLALKTRYGFDCACNKCQSE